MANTLSEYSRIDVFKPLCKAIAAHAKLPARVRRTTAAQDALASMVDAGTSLIRSESRSEEQRELLLCALMTNSNELVSAFPARNPNVYRVCSYEYKDLAKEASPEFLAALVAAGCDLCQLNEALVLRAIRKNDKALQDFLLANSHLMLRQINDLIHKLTTKRCQVAPEFVAAYMKTIVRSQPQRAEIAITRALACYSGLQFALLYHAGARVDFNTTYFMPDMARELYERISNHVFLQFTADGEDLAAFCRNEEAQARAIQMLKPDLA